MIRKATLLDVPTIVDLGEIFHMESRHANLSFNRQKVASVVAHLIDYPRATVLVAVRNGAVIGGIMAVAEEHFFSDELFSWDMATFIEPRHRGGFAASALLKAYAKWAQELGASCINAGIASGIGHDRSIRVFERAGFVQTGVTFEHQGKF